MLWAAAERGARGTVVAHGEPRTDRLFSVREVGGRGGRGRPGSHHISTVASVPSRVGCGSRSEAVERCVSSYCTINAFAGIDRDRTPQRSFNGRTRTYRRPLSTPHDLHRSDYWDQEPEHKVQAAHRRAAGSRPGVAESPLSGGWRAPGRPREVPGPSRCRARCQRRRGGSRRASVRPPFFSEGGRWPQWRCAACTLCSGCWSQ